MTSMPRIWGLVLALLVAWLVLKVVLGVVGLVVWLIGVGFAVALILAVLKTLKTPPWAGGLRRPGPGSMGQ